LHRAIFPEFHLADDSSSMRRFNTTQGGSYYAIGRGGAITGRGADLLVIDDLIKDSDEAQSDTVRRNLHVWYQTVAYPRLQPGGAIVLIQTRWHQDDLVGRLLREHPEDWEDLRLAAIAQTDESFRLAGEALWPQPYSLKDLEQTRVAIGSAAFESLYQENPAAAEGVIFKREWWRFYREAPVSGRIVQSWDTAYKSGSDNDFSVCTTWCVTSAGYFLLSLWRGKVEFPELKKRVQWLAREWKPSLILVEDSGSGQSLVQELRYGTNLLIIGVKVHKDKEERARLVTPLIEAGKVFLPESAPFLTGYIDELANFPNGPHDDQVDSTTLALNYLRHEPVAYVQVSTVRL
jgi:predicted phage terminase large subunit-like protein